MIKRTFGEKVFNVFNILLLSLFGVLMLYPLIYVLFASVSEPMEFLGHTGLLLKPAGFTLDAYKRVFQKPEIITGYLNTFYYVIVGTTISMTLSISLSYVVSRKNLYWNRLIMLLILFTMYFSGGLIPTYLVVRNLGLLDTRWAILLPTAINTFNLIILRTSFQGVPEAIEESAKIDGAGPFTTLVKVILPLVIPTVIVIALYYAVAQWNSWFQAAIYLRNANLYPLQLYLRDILIVDNKQDMLIAADSTEQMALGEVVKHATIIISILPIVCIYPFLQKYFVKGVMVGAVKG